MMKKRSLGTLLTVIVLLAVLALNVAASLLQERFMLFVDNTVTKYVDSHYTDDGINPPSFYTLQDETVELIDEHVIPMVDSHNAQRQENGEEPIKVNIRFCAERDYINSSEKSRYIMYTALWLQSLYPDHFAVDFMNISKNPSLAQKYKTTSATNIYSSNIIIEFGTEFRVYRPDAFFNFTDETSTTPWTYNGEKIYAAGILAVTRAESPICCITTNHGEDIGNISAFIDLIKKAGYIVMEIDLETDEIPEDCRMLITYDPQTDFHAFGNLGENGVSEIDKLDKYLDRALSFMLFVDNETPYLPNLEEYMEEWGVVINRAEDEDGNMDAYHMRDEIERIDMNGYTLLSTYATGGLGASVTSDMRDVGVPAKVIFPNATSIDLSESYRRSFVEADDTKNTPAYSYGSYYRNGIERNMAEIFVSGQNSYAEIDGKTYEVTTSEKTFKLMTLSAEYRSIQENETFTASDPSYVAVCASTEFVADGIIDSASYGNADVMLSCLRRMGRAVIPVDTIGFKAFHVDEVDTDTYTPSGMTATTILLSLLPLAAATVTGVIVTVKRKYS